MKRYKILKYASLAAKDILNITSKIKYNNFDSEDKYKVKTRSKY